MIKILPAFALFTLATWTSTQAGPNVLLITSEDHSSDIGLYGDNTVATPHLDALAARGVLFERAFVTLSVCSPSRGSILTGLYPHQNGQLGLATHGYHTYAGIPNLYQVMKDAGYRTGMIGKLHVNPAAAFPIDFWPLKSSNFSKKNMGVYDDHAAEMFEAGDEPFFLMVNYPDAHTKFVRQIDDRPPEPVDAEDIKVPAYVGVDNARLRSSIANYYNCLARLDGCMGELMQALEKSGKRDDTLVIWLSDHGSQIARGKVTCYEAGLRVPMIIDWPGVDVPHREKRMVSSLDILPTILAATGAKMPEKGAVELPGRDLRSLLENKPTPDWRTHIFAEYWPCSRNHHVFHLQQSVRDERFKLIANLHPGPNSVLTSYYRGKHKGEVPTVDEVLSQASPEVQAGYATWLAAPPFELYDLEKDPYEWTNLADDPKHAEQLDSLKVALEAWRKQIRDPMSQSELRQRYILEVTERKGRGNWSYEDYFDQRKN